MKRFPKKIIIISLGCSKNLVDSEQLHFHIKQAGFAAEHNPNEYHAETAIVNTCGFINDAKEESIDTILGLVEAKKEGKIRRIIVFGCLSQRYMQELKDEIPEVDDFIGNFDLQLLLQKSGILSPRFPEYYRTLDNPGHYAYLKIAEGCNRKCSFCAIPTFKGKYVSRTIDSVLHEAEYLAEKGVKELLLIAQDTSYYGYDLKAKYLLPELLKNLVQIKGTEWIRVHYLYPSAINTTLIETIAEHPKICKYFDIPVQHISNEMLKLMRRNTTKEKIVKLISQIKHIIPEAGLRTTVIAGYPGENEVHFEELLHFVEETRFDRLGAFTYSHEENTFGWKHHKDNVSEDTKALRVEKIMKLQQGISFEKNENKVGKTLRVIVDRSENNVFVGRTEIDSPEVDNDVIIDPHHSIKIGNFYNITVYEAGDYELFGRLSK